MVEIQPYEFKKKTNIEEHNDIVDKVNEIVGVINETQMDTIDTRLTAVEGDVTALESEVSSLDNELATKADKSEIPDTSTFATKTEVDAVDTKVDAIDTQLDSMQTEIDGKLSSIPIGGNNIGGVKNGGNVTINADGTMNASGTGTGINENVLTYAGNKLKSTVNGVDSNEVEIIAGGGGVSSVVVTNPSPGNITVKVDSVTGNADIDTLASGVEVYGSEFPADSGNASAYIKLNDSISTGEIGKYTESGISFIKVGNEDTRLLADTVELRNEVPDEGCKLTSGANGELLVNGVAMKNYTLPVGGTALGGVKNGGNVTIDAQGNMTAPAYTLPVASVNTLGGVKIGSGVSVESDGTISISPSSKNVETFTFNSITSLIEKINEKMPSIGDVICFEQMDGNGELSDSTGVSIRGSGLGGTVTNIDNTYNVVKVSISGAVFINNTVFNPAFLLQIKWTGDYITFFYVDVENPSRAVKTVKMTTAKNFTGNLNYIS